MLRSIGVSLLALCMVACASEPTSSDPVKLTDFDASKRFKKQWSVSVGDGQGNSYNRLAPALDNGDIFVASAGGDLVVVDKLSGDKRWKKSYDLRISGGVGVDSERIFLGTADGEVVAIDRASSEILWRQKVSGEVLAAPQSNGDVVVAQTYNGEVYAYNTTDGEQKWRYTAQVPRLTLRGTSTPRIVGNVVLVGFANGSLQAFDLESGNLLWQQRIAIPQGSTEIERLVDVEGRILLLDDNQTVVATAYQGQVIAIDVQSGRPRWVKEASSYVGATSALGSVYVVTSEGGVSAFDESGQGVSWTQTLLARRELTEPVAFRGGIAVGDYDGYLHLFAQLDGKLLARTRVDRDGLRASMISDGKLLYVFGNSGKLRAYKLQD